ncbi:hypothetical protein FHX58_002036 [Paraburkholderia tropica]|nr:hypothetical protein [Paraburkholderia tropica]
MRRAMKYGLGHLATKATTGGLHSLNAGMRIT